MKPIGRKQITADPFIEVKADNCCRTLPRRNRTAPDPLMVPEFIFQNATLPVIFHCGLSIQCSVPITALP